MADRIVLAEKNTFLFAHVADGDDQPVVMRSSTAPARCLSGEVSATFSDLHDIQASANADLDGRTSDGVDCECECFEGPIKGEVGYASNSASVPLHGSLVGTPLSESSQESMFMTPSPPEFLRTAFPIGCTTCVAKALFPFEGRVMQMAKNDTDLRWVEASGAKPMAKTETDCRELQRYIKEANADACRQVARELKGHVWKMIECKSMNHVLQAFIQAVHHRESQFIIDEICQWPGGGGEVYAAKHKYGCRVVQRLLEFCKPEQLRLLVLPILADTLAICKSNHGIYSLQSFFEHGAASDKRCIVKILKENVRSLCTDYRAILVVSKALQSAEPSDRVALGEALVECRDVLLGLAQQRHGQKVISSLLEVPNNEVRAASLRLLQEGSPILERNRYGRSVKSSLKLKSSRL